MKISLLCNAGLRLEYGDQILLIDVPNQKLPPFASLPEGEWLKILNGEPPYDRLCGLYFTHNHPDHCDPEKVNQFRQKWPKIPCFLPEENKPSGTVVLGPFVISYARMDHAPMEEPVPPHVVSWVKAGAISIYIAADAKLDCEAHRSFLKGRVAHGSFWNSMYLSRPDTRRLLRETALVNYIYHMPETEPDSHGIWKKCRNNFARTPDELKRVQVLERYPMDLEINE